MVGKVRFCNRCFIVEYEDLHLMCKCCGLCGHIAGNNQEKKVVLPENYTGDGEGELNAEEMPNM